MGPLSIVAHETRDPMAGREAAHERPEPHAWTRTGDLETAPLASALRRH